MAILTLVRVCVNECMHAYEVGPKVAEGKTCKEKSQEFQGLCFRYCLLLGSLFNFTSFGSAHASLNFL